MFKRVDPKYALILADLLLPTEFNIQRVNDILMPLINKRRQT